MMPENNMPKVNLSLPKEDLERFKQLAEKERRPLNQQFLFMMDFYLEYKDKVE